MTYSLPLYRRVVATLGFFPTYVTADAAFDAWYIYETAARHGGIAAIPLKLARTSGLYSRRRWRATLSKELENASNVSVPAHPWPTWAQRYRCPLLYPEPTGERCDHEQ